MLRPGWDDEGDATQSACVDQPRPQGGRHLSAGQVTPAPQPSTPVSHYLCASAGWTGSFRSEAASLSWEGPVTFTFIPLAVTQY